MDSPSEDNIALLVTMMRKMMHYQLANNSHWSVREEVIVNLQSFSHDRQRWTIFPTGQH